MRQRAMILVGSQRGGGKNLAIHLEKPDNDHVELHQLRGFASETLLGAFTEVYAISRATRCKQYLFSLSLNPPQNEQVGTDIFEKTIEQAERRLGLSGQPRAVVFHEKGGRRHAHVVWSRIDTGAMKAVQHSFFKERLRDLSRELYLEHGWKLPNGHADRSKRDLTNFTLAEWQQAKRAKKDAREVKRAFQDAWAISDSRVAFDQALKERGYRLARGDTRGFVGVDLHGEVWSVPRQAGVKTKDVRERLGAEDTLPTIAEVKTQWADQMTQKMDEFHRQLASKEKRREKQFERRHSALIQRQKNERLALNKAIERRCKLEAQIRQSRFTTRPRGVWDALRGEHKRIRLKNEQDSYKALKRDQARKDELVFKHLKERQKLSLLKLRVKESIELRRHNLKRDINALKQLNQTPYPSGPL